MRAQERLHDRITGLLARQVIEAASAENGGPIQFPKEADLCIQFGVSRTVIRESMKVLADKGMIEMKPRAGTRSTPRSRWRLLDPDILVWQSEVQPDAGFLRDLCEVRLAIEPTAASFAAVRATAQELESIEQCLDRRRSATRESAAEDLIDQDLEFHAAIVAASHNPMLRQLCEVIRAPFRTALNCMARFASTAQLGLEAHEALLAALRQRNPLAARRAAEDVVGVAMLAVEKAARAEARRTRK